jgi:N-methylhydantoinase A/oxoprolinase/acetone carboxylase beta subunit
MKKKAVEIIGKQILSAIAATGDSDSAFSLLAVGGGGGCIGAAIADVAGIGEIYVFRQGSVFGAFGSSGMDIMHQYKRLTHLSWEKGDAFWKKLSGMLNKIVLSLQRVAAKDMAGEGFTPEGIRYEVELQLELFPFGKMSRLRLPSPFLWLNKKQIKDMEERVEKLFLHTSGEAPSGKLFLSGVLLNALGRIPHAPMASQGKAVVREDIKKEGRRRIYTAPECWLEANVYQWDELSMPLVVEGPALVESKESTLFLPPGKTLEFDEGGNGIMRGSNLR